MNELWEDIPGYEGTYQVSNQGRVRSLRMLTPQPTAQTGYLSVTISGARRMAVHSLVAWAFIGPQPNGSHVHHKDGNKTNNLAENLCYVTPSEHIRETYRNLQKKLYFNDSEMDRIADMYYDQGRSVCEIAREFAPAGCSQAEYRRVRKKVRSVIEVWRIDKHPGHGWRGPHQPKLTKADAAKIREIYARREMNQTQLAKAYGCHPAHVSRIVNGLMHKEVTSDE